MITIAIFAARNKYPMIARRIFVFILLVICADAGSLAAQNVSVYFGENKTLYDSRYYGALFGEGVAPTFPTFDVKFGWNDNSSQPVAALCNHPEFGVGFQFDGLGDVKTASGPGIGNIYSIYGYFDRPVISAGRFRLGYSGEFGLAFMFNKRFDPVENPNVVIISSPVNSHISFGLQASYDVTPRYDVGLGFFFNHTSNGAVNFPNKGLNAFELALRLGMHNPARGSEVVREAVDDGFKRRFQFAVQASCGIMSNEAKFDKYIEEGVWVNDHYPKYAFEVNALYKYCRTQASGLGFDLFVTPFCKEIAENDGRGETYDPVSVGVAFLHEFSYRDFATMVGVGRYLYHNDGIARNKSLYQLVSIRYTFPRLANMYVGIVLKAHKFMAAESIQFCVGKRF